MKPIIGITVDCRHDPADTRTRGNLTLNWNYAEAVVSAGGVPLLIPPIADMDEVSRLIDGWLIPGGYDIDAQRFGEKNHPKAELQDPERYDGEARLFTILSPEIPILGICYGCQFLNVVRGGSLIQHLPDVVRHDRHTGGTDESHKIEESRLREAIGQACIPGKSYHHQAVDRLGKDLRAVSIAGDGTVEAIEATDRPWMIGVQWHPERLLDDEATRNLFRAFVARAARHAKSRQTAAAR